MKITKAVIPCGGMGTRFLPITKAVPKELLPIIDIPTVSYIIEEAARSGITDVLLVLGKGKEAIRHYFSPDTALTDSLIASGKTEFADMISRVTHGVNISYTYQEKPAGSGDAVYCAKSFTGSEPFCLAWGDDVIIGDPPAFGQLVSAYERAKNHIVGVQYYQGDDIIKYGVAKLDNANSDTASAEHSGTIAQKECNFVDSNKKNVCSGISETTQNGQSDAAAVLSPDCKDTRNNIVEIVQCGQGGAADSSAVTNSISENIQNRQRLMKCCGFVEKPALNNIPSRYAALGRYVLTPEIYSEIEKLSPVGGEYRLTDAIGNLCEKGRVFIYDFVGKRFDMGDKFGAVKATVELALSREFSKELKEYLKNLVKNF